MAVICGKEFPWAQALVANEQEERDAALTEISEWFKTITSLEEIDAKKIWYLFFNALWMTDRVLTQHDFCRRLSNTLDIFNPELAQLFIHAFFQEMLAEWNKLDKWRIDKFMVLVRYFVEKIIDYYRTHDLLVKLPDLIKWVLEQEGGIGLKTHFIDVIVDNIPGMCRDDTKFGRDILRPLVERFANDTTQIAVVKRLNDAVITPLLGSLGEHFFGTDVEVSINVIRNLSQHLRNSIKSGNQNRQIHELKHTTLQECTAVIAELLRQQAASGAPPEKSSDPQ